MPCLPVSGDYIMITEKKLKLANTQTEQDAKSLLIKGCSVGKEVLLLCVFCACPDKERQSLCIDEVI